MPKTHNEKHPTYKEGCQVCKWRSVAIAPSATPTRSSIRTTAKRNKEN